MSIIYKVMQSFLEAEASNIKPSMIVMHPDDYKQAFLQYAEVVTKGLPDNMTIFGLPVVTSPFVDNKTWPEDALLIYPEVLTGSAPPSAIAFQTSFSFDYGPKEKEECLDTIINLG